MIKKELKQEAEEYLRRQTQLNGGGIFHCNILNLILGFAEPREKRIAELEKENAELKSEKGCETCTKFDEVKLTEAKGIIRALLYHLSNDTFAVIYETKEESIERAKQFLSEAENDRN